MYDCQIYASRNLVFTGVNLVSSGVNRVSSSGNKKVRMPPIEQHPLQIRQRPVQKAQSQKKHCHRRVAEHELNRASQQQQPIENRTVEWSNT